MVSLVIVLFILRLCVDIVYASRSNGQPQGPEVLESTGQISAWVQDCNKWLSPSLAVSTYAG